MYGNRFAMRIWLNPDRLAGLELTPQDVEVALRAQNIEVPAGRVESREREFTVLAETDLREPVEFAQIIVKNTDEVFGPAKRCSTDRTRCRLCPVSCALQKDAMRYRSRSSNRQSQIRWIFRTR